MVDTFRLQTTEANNTGLSPKRYLFLFSDTGGGHRSGAEAVAQAMKQLYGDNVSIELLDIFIAIQKWPFNRFPQWYPSMLKAQSVPWKLGFKAVDRPKTVDSLTKLASPYVGASFRRILQQHPSDAIVSFHSIPNRMLGLTMAQVERRVPTATVVLDFLSAPAFWFAQGLDLYIIPFAEMINRAVQLGAPKERVETIGTPVRQLIRQGSHSKQNAAKEQLRLDKELPMILLVGGGEGLGPIEKIVNKLIAQQPNATIAIITGHNQRLKDRLNHLAKKRQLRIEGYTNRMDIWLRAADILITKAGPNSLAEAFIMGLPSIIYSAIPGQEEGNVTLVQKHQAGIWAPTPAETVQATMSLLKNPDKRRRMARRARSLATPDAADQIAKRLWNLPNAQ